MFRAITKGSAVQAEGKGTLTAMWKTAAAAAGAKEEAGSATPAPAPPLDEAGAPTTADFTPEAADRSGPEPQAAAEAGQQEAATGGYAAIAAAAADPSPEPTAAAQAAQTAAPAETQEAAGEAPASFMPSKVGWLAAPHSVCPPAAFRLPTCAHMAASTTGTLRRSVHLSHCYRPPRLLLRQRRSASGHLLLGMPTLRSS